MKNKTLSTRPGGGAGGGVPDRSMKRSDLQLQRWGCPMEDPRVTGQKKNTQAKKTHRVQKRVSTRERHRECHSLCSICWRCSVDIPAVIILWAFSVNPNQKSLQSLDYAPLPYRTGRSTRQGESRGRCCRINTGSGRAANQRGLILRAWMCRGQFVVS